MNGWLLGFLFSLPALFYVAVVVAIEVLWKRDVKRMRRERILRR